MPHRIAYFNGRFVPEPEARISPFDSGLLVGDMVYESTRTYGGRPHRLREHLRRLFDSLDRVQIDPRLSLDEIDRITLDTLARNRPTEADDVDWQIVHNISRGLVEPYRSIAADGDRPTVLVTCFPLVPLMGRFAAKYDRGVDLFVPNQRAIPAALLDPRVKTRSRIHFQLAQLEAQSGDGDRWPILVDAEERLTEGPAWNVFVVKNGTILTPSSDAVLAGVSRGTVFELAGEMGIPMVESDITRGEAAGADEMFCTATSFGAVFARTFESAPIGGGVPGPIYQRLLEAWKSLADIDFVAQARDYATRRQSWEASERDSERAPDVSRGV